MSTQTFFEFLSISNQEKIHSQILSWIFSENFKGILHTEKIKLFKNLFNIDVKKIEFSLTEYKNVDILIKTDKDIVVIENKLKSSQHSNQLDKYQKTIDNDFNNIKTNYFFLTLIGESSINTNWKNISYNDLFIALKKIEFQKNKDAIILEEYLAFLA
ncbi:MAG TPA: PD-(D/E)XK nuclease family protein [Gelidibacter sp.]|uniref:PD-(D/E)XK nuclease family protein n=1 Tax=Gelidibacter sp. TaxID=2018083 RepID=UPI002B8F18FB|nr:PD-(D/E)XK nuclease family protein [Gelidibacter sp.]HXJ99842.1 PD-(D/E)XK nuclease family protein [Gelidibacter sp.]